MSVIASQFIGMVVVFLFLAIGLLLYLFYSRPDLTGLHAVPTKDGHSIYPWFLLTELPTGLAGLAIAGFFAIAQGSLDSAMNALASSIVADIYLPMKNRRVQKSRKCGWIGRVTLRGRRRSGRWRRWGLALALFAAGCAVTYDPHHHSLLDFVQGLMTYALSGMLGVFLTALLTRRGNSASVVAALVVGVLAVAAMQDGVMGWWSPVVFGGVVRLAWPWWMPIATTLSFITCVLPRGRKAIGGNIG